MKINISRGNTNVIERGVYYYGLADYPSITTEDLQQLVAFAAYENSNGRAVEVVSDNEAIYTAVKNALSNPDSVPNPPLPNPNELVYHATDIAATHKILSTGKLLAATKIYGKTAEQLSSDKQTSLWNDPPDYFEYIMFCGGDNPTGDYVVLSANFPSDDDLASGNFDAGIRFYFRLLDLTRHSGHVFDGYHAIKVKDEINLSDYMLACVVPAQFKAELEGFALPELAAKIHFLPQRGISLQAWNNSAFAFATEQAN